MKILLAFCLFLIPFVVGDSEELLVPKDNATSSEKARSRLLTTSLLNEDGSFEFIASEEGKGNFIEIEGFLTTFKNRKTLELRGSYEFGKISLQFKANEYDGLIIKPYSRSNKEAIAEST